MLRRFSMPVLIFLFFFSLYALTASGRIQYGDEIEKYRVAQSIVERGDFSFRPTAVRNFTDENGRTYSIYELGQTVLEIPLYVVGKLVGGFTPQPDPNWIPFLFVGLLNPLLTALTCALLFLTCRTLGFRASTSLFLTFAFGLGTIAWAYAKGFTREPILTFLTLLSLFLLFRFQATGYLRWLLAAGLASGYLVFTKFIHAMVVPVLVVYIVLFIWYSQRRASAGTRATLVAIGKALVLFLLPAIIFLVIQSVYALVRFRSPFQGLGGTPGNPLSWISGLAALSHPGQALVALLISPEKSIFLYSPPALLFLVAWWKFFKYKAREALLFLALIVVELISVISRPDWDGGSWWGPRYLVQISPLLVIPLGVFESSRGLMRLFSRVTLAVLFLAGLFVQLVAVSANTRDYLDITGSNISLAGQIDFLRHGFIDSLVLYWSPYAFPIFLNPFAILNLLLLLLLGLLLAKTVTLSDGAILSGAKHLTPTPASNARAVHASRITPSAFRNAAEGGAPSATPLKVARLLPSAFCLLVLILQLGAFVAWVVAPYPQVLAAQGDTRFFAATSFLVDGRPREANALYVSALRYSTTFQAQAVAHVNDLSLHPTGESFNADDLMFQTRAPVQGAVIRDDKVTLSGEGALRLHLPSEEVASSQTDFIPVSPNTTYELTGWLRVEGIYGSGYGILGIYEDNGAWNKPRQTAVTLADETAGWQPFRKSITTLPTTRRLYISVGLWQTFGTLWVDGIELARLSP